jgi:hypothetical protein
MVVTDGEEILVIGGIHEAMSIASEGHFVPKLKKKYNKQSPLLTVEVAYCTTCKCRTNFHEGRDIPIQIYWTIVL